MKKGFTLIELLAILALLGIIILVTVPSIISTNQKSEENNYKQFLATIENATEIYIETHADKYETLKTTHNTKETVQIETLINGDYINSSLTNPRTDKTLSEENGSVTVTNKNGTLTYTYNQ